MIQLLLIPLLFILMLTITIKARNDKSKKIDRMLKEEQYLNEN